MIKEEFLKADLVFHRLWTKAVGTKDYNKKDWQLIARAMYEKKEFEIYPGWLEEARKC